MFLLARSGPQHVKQIDRKNAFPPKKTHFSHVEPNPRTEAHLFWLLVQPPQGTAPRYASSLPAEFGGARREVRRLGDAELRLAQNSRSKLNQLEELPGFLKHPQKERTRVFPLKHPQKQQKVVSLAGAGWVISTRSLTRTPVGGSERLPV